MDTTWQIHLEVNSKANQWVKLNKTVKKIKENGIWWLKNYSQKYEKKKKKILFVQQVVYAPVFWYAFYL